MLTGKDIHAMFLRFDELGVGWERLPEQAQASYDAVAKLLNESHITPLQDHIQKQSRSHMDSEIETLHDAFLVISDFQSQITALKTLVKDYIALVEQRIGIVNQIPPAGWSGKAIELETRAQQLLGEESKS